MKFALIPLTIILAVMSYSSLAVAEPNVSAKTAVARTPPPPGQRLDFGTPPSVSDQALTKSVQEALEVLVGKLRDRKKVNKALATISATQDVRLAWIVTDLMRFPSSRQFNAQLTQLLSTLLGQQQQRFDAWGKAVNQLMAWDIPAPPGYLSYKRQIYTRVVPAWEPLFSTGDVDWRHVSWGGVGIDARGHDKTEQSCNCIPAADDPEVSDIQGAAWLSDNATVFGVSVNGEHRAYPRQIMEVREMVNDTLGGRSLGIPYCTLCGSAQAWFTDQLPEGIERPILRTSGLLVRSNKVMYDLVTQSVLDTFLGTALTGPLAQKGLQLKQASVVTTSWGEWKKAHPTTTVLVERLALGRNFDFRNGRDANGPIFPIGDVDPRLAVQEDVLGVINPKGMAIAFHVPSLIAALNAGDVVEVEGVKVILDGGGVRAVDNQGKDLGTHQAFWFAWSQFYSDTKLWPSS